jgi:hypothetical protein
MAEVGRNRALINGLRCLVSAERPEERLGPILAAVEAVPLGLAAGVLDRACAAQRGDVAALCSRSGLSPVATRSWAAQIGPMPAWPAGWG